MPKSLLIVPDNPDSKHKTKDSEGDHDVPEQI